MLFGSTLLVSMDRITAEDGAKRAHYALVKGRRIVKSGHCVLDELGDLGGSALRASVVSPLSHLERVTLDAANAKLINFSARRFIDAESVFTEPYRIRSRVLSLQAGRADTLLAAMTEDDLQMAVEAMPSNKRPVEALAPAELAIAAAVGKVSSDRHLVFWARGDNFLAMVTERGRVLWRRMERLHAGAHLDDDIGRPENRWVKYEGMVDMTENSLDQAMRRSITSFLMLGELQGMPLEGEATLSDPLRKQTEKKLASLFRGKIDAVSWPELCGLPFVDPKLNLMDEEYTQQAQAWNWAQPVAALGILVGVAFAANGVLENRQAASIQAEVAQRAQQVEQENSALSARRPSAAILAQLDTDLRFAAEAGHIMRVDYFLEWLTGTVSNDAHIERLALSGGATPAARGARGRGAATAPAAGSSYAVTLDVRIVGDYESTKRTAETLVRRWNQRADLSGNTFAWDPVTASATLATRLAIQSGAF